jgi:phosphonate transport system ATP-binding protein
VPPAIVVSKLSKHFGSRPALDAVSLTIEPGELVALIGASGSGKSTLLRNIAGLTTADPTDGSAVEVGGRCVQRLGRIAPGVRDVRAATGFVFQQFNLVERLPVLTNVLVGLLHHIPVWRSTLRQFSREEIHAGLQALARVGLADHALQRASTLSGGQQQRVAIARTLVQRASIVLADEPIASLDPTSARRVMDILAKINDEDGTTVVVSIHQVDMALYYCPRTIALSHGQVVYDGPSSSLSPQLLQRLYGGEASELSSTSTDVLARSRSSRGAAVSPGEPSRVSPEFAALFRSN